MGTRIYQIILCLVAVWPVLSEDLGSLDPDFSKDKWVFRSTQRESRHDNSDKGCAHIHPYARDIVKRFYAILPYFDRDHSNSAFLHKFRGTIYGMGQGEDLLDREASFYATVLTPIVFLQHYRDTWCLLERFHRALRLYQISHPTDKRAALKLLQNLRAVNHKVRTFILDLPEAFQPTRATFLSDTDEEEFHDKKDITYLKELIKNLG